VTDTVKKGTKITFRESELNQPAHYVEGYKHTRGPWCSLIVYCTVESEVSLLNPYSLNQKYE